jgi:hypothetical protein
LAFAVEKTSCTARFRPCSNDISLQEANDVSVLTALLSTEVDLPDGIVTPLAPLTEQPVGLLGRLDLIA